MPLSQDLSAELELEKVRANRADELETELASAQEMIEDLQQNLW
jgi:Tfp pilus assembly protein FimV